MRAEGRKVKDGATFPSYFSLPRMPVCSCIKEHKRAVAFWADGTYASNLKEIKMDQKAQNNSVNDLASSWAGCTWDWWMPMFPSSILLPRAISGHTKPGIPVSKGKHGQVTDTYWLLAQGSLQRKNLVSKLWWTSAAMDRMFFLAF